MALACTKCNKSILDKDFLKCSKCKQTYDIQCSGRSAKIFLLMSADSKKVWTCLSCRSTSISPNKTSTKKTKLIKNCQGKTTIKNSQKNVYVVPSMSNVITECSSAQHLQAESSTQCSPIKGNVSSPPSNYQSANSTPSQDNITLRKPMQLRLALAPDSKEELEARISATGISFDSNQSRYSDDLNTETILDTYDQNRSCPIIATTTSELLAEYTDKIHHLELRLQSAEHEIEKLILENGTLRKQIQDNDHTIKNLTRICTSTSKKPKRKMTRKNWNDLKLDLNQSDENDISKTITNNVIQSEVNRAPREHSRGRKNSSRSKSEGHHNESPPQEETNTSTPIKTNSNPATADDEKLQLCILSNQRNNHILNAVDYAFDRNVRYCHFVTPNKSVTGLLSNLEQKLQNFTMDDYCVIYIGEQDINESDNGIQLVNCIRDSLMKITHTNKIICLPTYVCGSLIYNYKVELFGNLLAMDMQSNDYAYLFDTNRDLTLDMFSNNTGKITKFGIRSAFVSLKKFILNLKDVSLVPASNSAYLTDTISPKTTATATKVRNKKFFRE